MSSTLSRWFNALAIDRMALERIASANDRERVVKVAERLAAEGVPTFMSYVGRMDNRRKICQAAFAVGVDLTKVKDGRGRVMMGRGLLDVWLREYALWFGGAEGTMAARETVRRNVVRRMSQAREL